MWLLLQALLLVQVNLSTSTFCKSLKTNSSDNEPRLCGQGNWVASNNDAYLLSATCDPNLVFVEIYKNPESIYATTKDLFEVYSIDYNCTGDDSLTFPDGNHYRLDAEDGHNEKDIAINTTREVSCIITGCVYVIGGHNCWSRLESIAQCMIKAPIPVPTLSISSTILSSPVSALISNISSVITQVSLLTSPSISHSAITSQTSVTKQSDITTSIIIEASSEARVTSIAWNSELSTTTGIPHPVIVTSIAWNSELSTTTASSMLIERPSSTAAAKSDGSQLNPIVIAILVILVVVMVTSVVSLCFVLLTKRWKIHKSTGHVFEYDWRTSFTNDETNIKIHKSDRISITESLVTITQSLELTLPTSNGDPTQVLVTSEHQSTEYIIKDDYEGGLRYSDIIAEGESQLNEEDTQTMSDKTVDRCFDSSSSSHNDTMSCMSRSSTDGYIITSNANQHDRHIEQAGDEGRLPNRTTALPSLTLSRHIDSETSNSNEQQFTLSNESLSQPVSEGYIMEHDNSTIVPVCLYEDKERDGERYDSESDCYLSEGPELFNATVNDYVFQKKINNRLTFSTAASSGYSSDHTPNSIGTSYILGGSSTGYVDSHSIELPDLGYNGCIDDDGYFRIQTLDSSHKEHCSDCHTDASEACLPAPSVPLT